MSFITDIRYALRSLGRVKGLAITVIVTLALGIGANAAIFSVVRGVLLRPLANRDENRLIYIRQTALGIGADNANFSVPELRDLRSRVRTINAFGDFSQVEFTMVGLGEPRVVRAGVVSGSYFDVMGLRPVLGRLIGPSDDGPKAAGAAVLTHRFWTTTLAGDRSVIGKVVRLGERSATIVGVVEPSVPYPAETEIIANIVTSPHHLSATMVTGRVHRMTELFGRLAPGADLETARTELRSVHGAMLREHHEAYPRNADFRIDARSEAGDVERDEDQQDRREQQHRELVFELAALLRVGRGLVRREAGHRLPHHILGRLFARRLRAEFRMRLCGASQDSIRIDHHIIPRRRRSRWTSSA